MVGVLEDEIDTMAGALARSKYSKEESIHIMKEYTKFLMACDGNRHNASMITADYTKRIEKHSWKFPHGFFGNWAKSRMESIEDPFDVNDIGC